ncbi:MAG TPA: VOC family protein [Acidobacteriaceae bacterium]|nr:VOC family protein [Acidobacteriaceae bacterium]
MPKNQFAYLELSSTHLPTLKRFYGTLFGWTFEDFGDDYVAVHGSGLEAGFNAHPDSKSKAPLAMVETTEIEAMEARVRDAGGTITMPIFAYPGGRRFHFVDPDGNELAVMQAG